MSKTYDHKGSISPAMESPTRHPDHFLTVVCAVFDAHGPKRGEFEFPVCAVPQIGDFVTLRGEKFWQVVKRAIDARDINHNTEIWLWVQEPDAEQ